MRHINPNAYVLGYLPCIVLIFLCNACATYYLSCHSQSYLTSRPLRTAFKPTDQCHFVHQLCFHGINSNSASSRRTQVRVITSSLTLPVPIWESRVVVCALVTSEIRQFFLSAHASDRMCVFTYIVVPACFHTTRAQVRVLIFKLSVVSCSNRRVLMLYQL